jgi:hypothetical protein
MKIEHERRRHLPARERILPVLQRVLNRVHRDRMAADDFDVLDLAVWRNHHLHLYDPFRRNCLAVSG